MLPVKTASDELAIRIPKPLLCPALDRLSLAVTFSNHADAPKPTWTPMRPFWTVKSLGVSPKLSDSEGVWYGLGT